MTDDPQRIQLLLPLSRLSRQFESEMVDQAELDREARARDLWDGILARSYRAEGWLLRNPNARVDWTGAFLCFVDPSGNTITPPPADLRPEVLLLLAERGRRPVTAQSTIPADETRIA